MSPAAELDLPLLVQATTRQDTVRQAIAATVNSRSKSELPTANKRSSSQFLLRGWQPGVAGRDGADL